MSRISPATRPQGARACFRNRSLLAHEVLLDFGPPGWRMSRALAHGGWDAPEPFMSEIGTLLPMALRGRTSL